MRTAALVTALVLIVLSIPAIARADSAIQHGSRVGLIVEGARAIVAIAAASLLLTYLLRTR